MRRRAKRRVAIAVVAGITVPLVCLTPVSAHATSARPTSVVPTGCSGVTVLLQPACDALHLAGKAVGFVAPAAKAVIGTISDTVMSGITNFVVNGAVWFVTRVADAIDSSTSVDVTSGWFGERYRIMAGIAAAFTLLFLLLSCAATILHRDPARLGRAIAMVAAAGLGTFAA